MKKIISIAARFPVNENPKKEQTNNSKNKTGKKITFLERIIKTGKKLIN